MKIFRTREHDLPAPADVARAKNWRPNWKRHNYLYHTLDAPEISDEEYDALFGSWWKWRPGGLPLKRQIPPTSRVGGSAFWKARLKMPHSSRMYGLDNVFPWRNLRISRKGLPKSGMRRAAGPLPRIFGAIPKLDGLALEIVYLNGQHGFHAPSRGVTARSGSGYRGSADHTQCAPDLAGQWHFSGHADCSRRGCALKRILKS